MRSSLSPKFKSFKKLKLFIIIIGTRRVSREICEAGPPLHRCTCTSTFALTTIKLYSLPGKILKQELLDAPGERQHTGIFQIFPQHRGEERKQRSGEVKVKYSEPFCYRVVSVVCRRGEKLSGCKLSHFLYFMNCRWRRRVTSSRARPRDRHRLQVLTNTDKVINIQVLLQKSLLRVGVCKLFFFILSNFWTISACNKINWRWLMEQVVTFSLLINENQYANKHAPIRRTVAIWISNARPRGTTLEIGLHCTTQPTTAIAHSGNFNFNTSTRQRHGWMKLVSKRVTANHLRPVELR